MTNDTGGAQDALEKVGEAYTVQPWWYDVRGFFILLLAHNNTLGSQIRWFGPNYGADDLELACGNGTLLKFILNWRRRRGLPAGNITGIDYSGSMLAGARRHFAGRANMKFLQADAARLPFADSAFDTVNIINAVHCFPDVDAALRSAYRVLKPGGKLSANVVLNPRGVWPLNVIAARINRWGVRTGNLFKAYDKDEILERFVSAGFKITESELSGNCLNLRATKPAPGA